MSNLSPGNKIISSIQRSRYIDKLRGNIGAIKDNCRTPLHHKLYDTYEGITGKIPTKLISLIFVVFIICNIILYYSKPFFVMKNVPVKTKKPLSTTVNSSFKISSLKNQDSSSDSKDTKDTTDDQDTTTKVISYYKLVMYSLLITLLLFAILYFTRTKVAFIAKLLETECE